MFFFSPILTQLHSQTGMSINLVHPNPSPTELQCVVSYQVNLINDMNEVNE